MRRCENGADAVAAVEYGTLVISILPQARCVGVKEADSVLLLRHATIHQCLPWFLSSQLMTRAYFALGVIVAQL